MLGRANEAMSKAQELGQLIRLLDEACSAAEANIRAATAVVEQAQAQDSPSVPAAVDADMVAQPDQGGDMARERSILADLFKRANDEQATE